MIGAITSLSVFLSIAAGFEVRVALIVGLYSVESLIAFVTRCTVVVGLVMFGYVAVEVS